MTCDVCGQETVNNQEICGHCAMDNFAKNIIILWQGWKVKNDARPSL